MTPTEALQRLRAKLARMDRLATVKTADEYGRLIRDETRLDAAALRVVLEMVEGRNDG